MGLLKTAIVGAAIYAAVKYVTKKHPKTGKSIIDDLSEKAPEWTDRAKELMNNVKDRSAEVRNKNSY